MQCVFLLQTDGLCHCEVLADRYGDRQQLSSSWSCQNALETLCPYFQGATLMEDRRVDLADMFDLVDYEMPSLHPSRIGHFNRIGGFRALLPNLT
jgi:hypothetical protein